MSAVTAVIREAFAGKPYSEGKEAAIAAALRDAQADVVALVAVDGQGDVVGQIQFSPVTLDGRPSDWHALGRSLCEPTRRARDRAGFDRGRTRCGAREGVGGARPSRRSR